MRSWHLLLLCAAIPAIAAAGVPTVPGVPGTCSRLPNRVVLVGTNGGQPDTQLGSFEVEVCRYSLPLASAMLNLTTFGVAPGVRLGREAEPAPAFADCLEGGIRYFADANGIVRATLAGSVDLSQQVPGVAPLVAVYANGVKFGDLPVICYDLDGAGGVGAGDLSAWLTLFGSGEPWLVADYNGDGVLGADDLSQWFEVFGSGSQAVSAAPLCP